VGLAALLLAGVAAAGTDPAAGPGSAAATDPAPGADPASTPAAGTDPLGAAVEVPVPAPIPLPSSKLLGAVPGEPRPTNSFPSATAVSPDGRLVALLNNGFGTAGTGLHQSIGLLDRATGALTEVPDPRLGFQAHQTAFVGLAFSSDGRELYVSFASMSDPEGATEGATGNGVAVYAVAGDTLTPSRFLPIPLRVVVPATAVTPLPGVAAGSAVPYPAGIAVVPGRRGDRLLVAADLSDEVIELDARSGRIRARYPVGTASGPVPSQFPFAVVAAKDGRRAWVSLWNGSAVAELDLRRHKVRRTIPLLRPADPTAAGSHPTALLLAPNERRLYVTLGNADAVAVIDPGAGRVKATWSTRLPGQTFGGSIPNALALSADGRRLFVADAGAYAVAVMETRKGKALGFVPTEWYPTALAVVGNDLVIATGKGKGVGPNNGPPLAGSTRKHPYIASILPGSVARVAIDAALADLPALTEEVRRANRMTGEPAPFPFADPAKNPIRHVLYVIKENRTYDQVLGDLGVGNGDPSLVLYGADITPNEHALARRFGVIDNFYCSGEVSGGGHVWSTAATTSDYTERTWQIGYRSDERTYDFEGQVLNVMPLDQGQPDIDEPGTGYLWANADRHGVSHRNYGEFVTSVWCDDPAAANPGVMGTPLTGSTGCPASFVTHGNPLPDGLGGPAGALGTPGAGGAPSPYPWPVPILARNVATKPELRGNFSPRFADFRIDYPDQLRADTFVAELGAWVQARAAGQPDPMPQLLVLRLPNDHTAGVSPGFPTPAAAVADNDLALGRVVEAVSHSIYWDDTAIFVVEDDAQDGADHVDAHRSTAFVVSRYAPVADHPFVDSTFYTTVSTLHTMELLLGLPPMNNNDAWAPPMAPLFSGPGSQPAFVADTRNRDNGLLYQANPAALPDGGTATRLDFTPLDFTHADAVDTTLLNAILWRDRKGDLPMPEIRHTVFPVGGEGAEEDEDE
jgi:DNA-binding beta-propeller fold protein YncE